MLINLFKRLFTRRPPAKADVAVAPHAAKSPAASDASLNEAYALMQAGRIDEAAARFEAAIAMAPGSAPLHNDLGLCHAQLGNFGKALEAFQQALAIDGRFAPALANLGNLHLQQGDPGLAEKAYRRALEVRPDDASLWHHLSISLRNAGRPDESLDCSRQALALAPDDEAIRANLIFTLVLAPSASPADLLHETRTWARMRAESLTAAAPSHNLAAAPPHANSRAPDRPLRIGYVSGDLRQHPVANFIEPVLEHHDRASFITYCYANNAVEDDQSARLREFAAHWRNVAALPDAELATQIRADEIDLLVDLSGHTWGNRLLAFAHKPAPLQLTWLGFPGSTGMSAMDYRITDAELDPPEAGDACYVEQQLRLPHSLWCYRPLGEFDAPSPPPMLHSGQVSFGSFNGFHKITQALLEDWAQLLAQIPASRLIMVTVPEGDCRERILATFEAAGVSRDRLNLRGRLPVASFRALQRDCDIALDAYPCGGGATTCEVLWMGVPVITRRGATPVSRAGASLLKTLGLTELIAADRDSFIAIARSLAADPHRLAALRQGMRERMLASPLMQEEAFTRSLEGLYRQAWKTWCEK